MGETILIKQQICCYFKVILLQGEGKNLKEYQRHKVLNGENYLT